MTNLVSMLEDLLAVSVAALDDPPDRQFVAHGDFAHDCPLVAVRIIDFVHEPQTNDGGCAVIPVVTFDVTVLRCYAASTEQQPVPTAESITDDALVLARDANDLSAEILDQSAAGTLFDGVTCGDVNLSGGLEAVGPEGGIAGWRLTLSVRM